MASAQSELSEIDRELLLEKLKAIQETSNKTVQGRHSVALSAFKVAVNSDSAALDLYLKCSEKVEFVDQAKKAQEFREWKRRRKDTHADPGFKRALRHQLAWLLTTIEAAGSPKARENMSDRALKAINDIFVDGEVIDRHRSVLTKSVLDSNFAKAYNLDKLPISDWPTKPLVISEMYEKIILPPHRNEKSLSKLREAWSNRIKHEGTAHQIWGTEGTAGRDRKPEFENWRAKERLDLVWQMETDLFSSGDQKAAALRMLDHLKENLSHTSAPGWISEFTNLINGKPAREAEPDE